MVPLLQGQAERIYGDDDAIGYELNGHRALFLGDHKIVYNRPPIGDGVWHSITSPPILAKSGSQELQPQRFARMQALYEQFVEQQALPVQRISIRNVMFARLVRTALAAI